jgi:hypothetical protein
MLDEGIRRIDQFYADALAMGMLRPDPSLIETPTVDPNAMLANMAAPSDLETLPDNTTQTVPGAEVTTITVQFETPDVGSVGGIEASVKSVPGVRSATTTSLALGGTSVMSVAFSGDVAALKGALEARGFKVEEGGGALRIRRP